MKFFLMLIGLVLPILVFSDEKPRMEVPSEGRKLRGNDKYYQKSLPIKALKKVSAAFPEEILAGNNTLDGKAGTVSTLSENVLKKKNLKSKTTYYCFYYYDGYDDYECCEYDYSWYCRYYFCTWCDYTILL